MRAAQAVYRQRRRVQPHCRCALVSLLVVSWLLASVVLTLTLAGTARRFMLIEDAVYERRVQFEEVNPNMPGQQFYQ